jgi:hypothetical protein
MKISELVEKKYFLKRHPKMSNFFYFYDDDNLVLLRINVTPEESLFDIINGLEVMIGDDIPPLWELEGVEK